MSALFPDTSPAVEARLLELLQLAPAWRKLELVADLNATVRTLALAGLRERHPEAGEARLRQLLAGLLWGPDLAAHLREPGETGEGPDAG